MNKNTGDGELAITFSDLVQLVRKEYSNERDNISYQRAAKIVDKAINPQLAQEAKALITAAKIDPFAFVEPCEPECSPERHAYHKGQWDMAVRIESFQESQ